MYQSASQVSVLSVRMISSGLSDIICCFGAQVGRVAPVLGAPGELVRELKQAILGLTQTIQTPGRADSEVRRHMTTKLGTRELRDAR